MYILCLQKTARASGSPSSCSSATCSPPSRSSCIRIRACPACRSSATSIRWSSCSRCPSTSCTSASATGTANETASTPGNAGKSFGDLLLVQTKGTALRCSPLFFWRFTHNPPYSPHRSWLIMRKSELYSPLTNQIFLRKHKMVLLLPISHCVINKSIAIDMCKIATKILDNICETHSGILYKCI